MWLSWKIYIFKKNSFKIFHRFWLAQSPRLIIFITNHSWPNLEDASQLIQHLFDCIDWKWGSLGNIPYIASVNCDFPGGRHSCLLKRELEKIVFKAIRKRNGWPNFWLKLNGRNARMRKTYCSIEEYLPVKKICLILKPCREIAQSFEESLRWGKLVKT